MGGGAVWRGVTRVVSPAVRVAAASTSTSCRFCKKVGVGKSAQASKVHSASAQFRSCSCTSAQKTSASVISPQQQGAAVALWDADEWEFAEEEERVDHLVFGSLPSKTEIEEASSELQNALRLGLVAQQPAVGSDDQTAMAGASRVFSPAMIGQNGESSAEAGNEVMKVSNPNVLATRMALDWVEPPPIGTGQGILQCGRRDNVLDAFRQFQHNPEVQSMVKSLATDPAIWEAVLSNEKIQEFKRKLQKDKAISSEGKESVLAADCKTGVVKFEEVVETGESEPSFFTRWQSYWQEKISAFMDVLSHLIDSLFKGADRKLFAEEDGDIVDRTVKSCTMLALVVLCVVLLKRLQAA
ncbi:unnamed protein product [Calypogeia fissa]